MPTKKGTWQAENQWRAHPRKEGLRFLQMTTLIRKKVTSDRRGEPWPAGKRGSVRAEEKSKVEERIEPRV